MAMEKKRNMKKLSALLFTVLLFFVGVVVVNAKTEADLLEALSQNIELKDGSTWSLSDGDLKKAKDYLNKYEISSDDVDYIISQIDAAKEIIKSEGTSNFSIYSASHKSELKELVAKVDSKTNVKAEVKDGAVIIYNVDSNGNKTSVFYEVTNLVKQTGSSNTMTVLAYISLVIISIGTVLVAREIRANI